jgi:hypothetical protein
MATQQCSPGAQSSTSARYSDSSFERLTITSLDITQPEASPGGKLLILYLHSSPPNNVLVISGRCQQNSGATISIDDLSALMSNLQTTVGHLQTAVTTLQGTINILASSSIVRHSLPSCNVLNKLDRC